MTVTPGRRSPTERSIAPPVTDKHPLKVNVFERMQSGNAQLLPLFPYMDAGSMVPAGALLRGGTGVDYGQFFHTNTVDEVIIVFGARGAFLQAGQVYVGARTHSVTSHLKDQSDPEGLLVLVITQRQSPNASQEEAITFRCQACNEVLLRHDYTAPTVPLTGRPADNHIPTCTRCGWQHPEVDLDALRWEELGQALRATEPVG
jgi:hypothetical protein